MNYQAHYDRIIDRARNRKLNGYFERHHVVPKCLGGGNSKDNIVPLTPEEHFVAHQLLVKMHPGNYRLLWAASQMTGKTRKHSGRKNKLYGWLRRRLAEDTSKRWKGYKHTDEARKRMSASHMGVKLGPHSDEHKARISAAHVGRIRGPQSEQRKRHSSEGMTNGMLKVWQERKQGKREMPHKNAKGIYLIKQTNRWRAQIVVDGKKISLGCYSTAETATEVYQSAVKKYQYQSKT